MIDLDEIEARANAATPGPWVTFDSPGTYWDDPSACGWDYRAPGRAAPYYCTGPGALTSAQAARDTVFIAHARTDVPALIARVRKLEERLSDTEDRRYRLMQKLDEALADYQDLGRTMHEECSRLEERLLTAEERLEQRTRERDHERATLAGVLACGGSTYSEGETLLRAQAAEAQQLAKQMMDERDELRAECDALRREIAALMDDH